MNLVYFLVSEDVILDSRSNKVSVMKVAETIRVDLLTVRFEGKSGVKWARTSLVAACCFKAESEEEGAADPVFSLTIVTPTREISPVPFSAQFREKPLSRSYIDLPGIPDDGTGEYKVILAYPSADMYKEAIWNFDVEFEDQADSEPSLIEETEALPE